MAPVVKFLFSEKEIRDLDRSLSFMVLSLKVTNRDGSPQLHDVIMTDDLCQNELPFCVTGLVSEIAVPQR